MGIFLQTDPIGSKDDLDLYAYTAEDPVDGRDPTGMSVDLRDRDQGCKSGCADDPQPCSAISFCETFIDGGTGSGGSEAGGPYGNHSKVKNISIPGFETVTEVPSTEVDPLDPHQLNAPLTPKELEDIRKTWNIIENGSKRQLKKLNPHGYGNFPSEKTGAILPPGHYRTYYIPSPGPGAGDNRLVVDQISGAAYYTNNHYLSFVGPIIFFGQ